MTSGLVRNTQWSASKISIDFGHDKLSVHGAPEHLLIAGTSNGTPFYSLLQDVSASLISVPQRVVHAIVENVSYNELCFAIKISRSESGHGNFSSRYGLRVIIDIQDWTNQS